jgi:hypothetical protein
MGSNGWDAVGPAVKPYAASCLGLESDALQATRRLAFIVSSKGGLSHSGGTENHHPLKRRSSDLHSTSNGRNRFDFFLTTAGKAGREKSDFRLFRFEMSDSVV